jgi:hypothetical protein
MLREEGQYINLFHPFKYRLQSTILFCIFYVLRMKALKLLNERLGTEGVDDKVPLLRSESPEDHEGSVSISIPSSSSGMQRSSSAGASLPALGGSGQTSSPNKSEVIIPVSSSGF